MIATLTGENSFALKQRLDELTQKFVAKNGELALQRVDAEEADASSMKEAILAVPFLSNSKMVVVRNGSANKDFAEQIEQIISSITGSTDLILYEPSIDKRTAYYKVLKDQTQFEQFSLLDRNELSKWLVAEAKKLDAKLSFPDAIFLVERLGQNQQMLFNELTKLAIYDSEISRSSIEHLTEPTPQSKVFDLLDAAFAGRKARALDIYDEQRAQKVEPQAILAMIAWQLQIFTLLKFAEAEKKTTSQIAKDSGVGPYPLNKAAGAARRLDEQQLRQMVDEAFDMDIKSKTKSIDLDEALKTYITTL